MILHCTFTAESDSESILKIGQHLPKLWAIKYRVVFYETRVYVVDNYMLLNLSQFKAQNWH